MGPEQESEQGSGAVASVELHEPTTQGKSGPATTTEDPLELPVDETATAVSVPNDGAAAVLPPTGVLAPAPTDALLDNDSLGGQEAPIGDGTRDEDGVNNQAEGEQSIPPPPRIPT